MIAVSGFAQDEICIAQLARIEKAVNNVSPEEAKWVKKSFGELVCGGTVSENMRADVWKTLDLMEEHKISPSNGMLDYLHAVHDVVRAADTSRWTAWHEALFLMLNDKRQRKQLGPLLRVSSALLLDNVLYQGPRHTWRLEGKPWYFEVLDDRPLVRFDSCQLFVHHDGDTLSFDQVTGQWDVTGTDCEISKSRFPWIGTEFDPEKTYALLPARTVNLKQDDVNEKDVVFYAEFSTQPLLGDLTAKLEAGKRPDSKSYPTVRCNEANVVLDSLFDVFRFTGGLQIRGSQIRGISSLNRMASMEVMQSDTVFMRFQSDEIIIHPRGWNSRKSISVIYFEGDSVSHPACDVRFEQKSQVLSVTKQGEGLGQQAFDDSYHHLEWDVEGYTWKVGMPQIEIGYPLIANAKAGAFRSTQFFEKQSFDQLQGIDPIHPVVELYRFIQSSGLTSFTSLDYAHHIRLSEVQARIVLMNLSNAGYLEFDPDDNLARVLPRTSNHMQYATKKRDHDVIQFLSAPNQGNNAEWSLLNGFLQINGVDRLVLSSARNVSLMPENGEVIVSKGLDMVLSGLVDAGNIRMRGNGMAFNYEGFTIDFRKIDEVRLSINDLENVDYRGLPQRVWLRNGLQDISGRLAIDHPNNRSGNWSGAHPTYPQFTSNETSFVYYDSPNLFDGAYHRNSFYFAVRPFQLNGLDQLTRDNLYLDGTLVSGGIVPDIEQPLVVMEDNFLGLTSITPSTGTRLYGGAAAFTSTLTLNGSGLRGDGTIDFLHAHAEGEDLVFLPDSIMGPFATMDHAADAADDVPSASAKGGQLRFYPGDELLSIRSGQTPIVLYDGESRLTGTLNIETHGVGGRGTLDLTKAELQSEDYEFEFRKTKAAHAAFQLFGSRGSLAAFETRDLKCDLDFDQRVGEFTPNSGETAIDLPIQQYLCYMDKFRWFMDEDEIDLISERDMAALPLNFSDQRIHSNFISTHPAQDSLHFLSTHATYLVGNDILNCKGVKEIAIADARIFPDSGRVTIRPKAVMEPLERARVIANATTQHHLIEDANLTITGRYHYSGAGVYQFTWKDRTVQPIMLDEIFVDEGFQTRATGSIYARDAFLLDPHFAFAGNVEMKASEEFLVFEGGARMTEETKRFELSWIQFQAAIDPDAVAIPLNHPILDVDGDPLACGMMASSRPPYTMYPAFLDPLGDAGDSSVLVHEGALRFKDHHYIVSSLEAFENPKAVGNSMQLDVRTAEFTGTGRIELPLNFGLAQAQIVGDFSIDGRGDHHFKGTVLLNYHFNSDLFERMAMQVPSWQVSEPIELSSTNYEYALETWLGAEDSQKLINDLAMTGKLKNIPKVMQESVVLTGVDLVWNDAEEAWISTSKFGVASLGKEALFMQIPGKLELKRSRSGDMFVMYLHGDEENWYYHEYKLVDGRDGSLKLTTSDMTFYEILAEIKADKRKEKAKDGRTIDFDYMSSRRRRDNLVDKYRDFE